MTHILIVEDESRIASFIKKGLVSNGFTTSAVSNGEEAIAIALDAQIDLMILDLGLPNQDGLDLLENLRGQGFSAPVIILTARDDIRDKVSGFERGADDYMTKPFRFEELLVRIRARLRPVTGASSAGQTDTVLMTGQILLDLKTRRLNTNGRTIDLSAREFALAETFLRHPNQVMSREQLLDQVWGYDYAPGSNIVDVYVGYLRKKLGDDVIETVRGMGYRLRS
ncbi:response regulator transcription factor [Oscillatoria sp. CS-180]|uniref:response regulator transcription factor n=1 Tax=Oscillatoria sp. CS-180 TaxID=3021720 RepID=UPI002331554D|nr:response regulator transcription factor [Oscillatoria sp. CS-180]MDB9527265.1 response regulator transcription factor [Oscillatoria sp. CS-180]